MPAVVINRVAGITYVYTDGQTLPVGGTVTLCTWDAEKESVKGLSGVQGFKETPVAPYIEIEVITTADLDLQVFQGVTNSTVTVELANGQVWVLKQAWCTKAPDHNAGDGTATLRFEGRGRMERTR